MNTSEEINYVSVVDKKKI